MTISPMEYVESPGRWYRIGFDAPNNYDGYYEMIQWCIDHAIPHETHLKVIGDWLDAYTGMTRFNIIFFNKNHAMRFKLTWSGQ